MFLTGYRRAASISFSLPTPGNMSNPVAFVLSNDSRYTVVLRRDHAMKHWDTSYTLKPHATAMIDAMPGEHFRLAQMSASVAYGVKEDAPDTYSYGEFTVPADAPATMQGGTVPIYHITENNFVERQPMVDGTHMLTVSRDMSHMHESPKAGRASRMTDADYARALGAGVGASVLILLVFSVIKARL